MVEKKTEEWNLQQMLPAMRALGQGVSFQTVIEIAFSSSQYSIPVEVGQLVCIDERVQPQAELVRHGSVKRKIGMAGQGILAPREEIERFVRAYRGRIPFAGSHYGCGAAREAHEMGIHRHVWPDANPSDILGMVFTDHLAKKLGARYHHQGRSRLLCTFHNARVIYISFIGFDPGLSVHLPPGFLVSEPELGFSDRHCGRVVDIATTIAMGDHGFGRQFFSRQPLYICVIGKTDKQIDRGMAWADIQVRKYEGLISSQAVKLKM